MAELFRKEAVAHATRRLTGEVVLAAPPSLKLLAGLLVGVVGAGAAFASTASYARKETAPGWLVPEGGLVRVTARQGGLVEVVSVNEGRTVQAGQAIATVRLSADLDQGDVGAALAAGLNAEAAAAEARAAAERAKLSHELAQMGARSGALRRELEESRRRISLQGERVRLAEVEVARAEEIAAKGFLPRRELDARRSALLAAENELSSLRSAALSLERQIGEVQAQAAAAPSSLQALQADVASARAGLSQKRTETAARSTYVVTAAIPGRVAAIPVARGQTLQPGATVAVVTPVDSQLEAELYVTSRASGFVRPGQEVRLMYQAFPHQKFGTGRGVVSSVSRTVLAPGEVSLPGVQVSEPVFRVRVRLTREAVQAYGESLALQPGMLLSADVVIDRRSLVEWLLDPLYAAGRRS